MTNPDAWKILEVGQFGLIKRNRPAQTTFIFTGANPARVDTLNGTIFGAGRLAPFARSLARNEWDIAFCHVPVAPVWDGRYGLPAALGGLLRRLRHPRTLGTYVLHWRSPPLVLLDFNDEPNIPRHVFPLLDRSIACYKRELPYDHAKAFVGTSVALRNHRDVMMSDFVRRNLPKIRPISAAVREETVRQALETSPEKSVDVFFAGAVNSTLRAAGLAVLKSLQAEGYVVDCCEGGLSKREYLARCARAWLTWSPEGYGWECLRHYEASLCLSVPVLSPPGIDRHFPLLDRVHAIYYPVEGNGLRDAIVGALRDRPGLEAMARAARAHVLRHHTHSKIVDYMLQTAAAQIPARGTRPHE